MTSPTEPPADGNPENGLPASLFNGALSAFAIVTAWEIGLLDLLEADGVVSIHHYVHAAGLHEPSVRAVLGALAGARIVELTDDGQYAKPTPAFAAVYATKGFFGWLLGGCGELLRTGAVVARNEARHGNFIHRDVGMIGYSTADFGRRYIDPVLDSAFADLHYSCVADLGCGSGDRLIRMLNARPQASGIGVDIAPVAVEQARERVARAGLSHRAVIIEADVHSLRPRAEFAAVDFATCFLMGHDFWPRDRCRAVLRGLRAAFPRLRVFALGDTYRSQRAEAADPPILTLGFEYVHGLMGQYLPTLQEWRAVFPAAGWRCQAEYDITIPPYTKIFRLVPA